MSVLPFVGDHKDAMRSALLVIYADPEWTFDAERHALRRAGAEVAADLISEEGNLRIFQLRGAAAP
jgi:hypothetical protein